MYPLIVAAYRGVLGRVGNGVWGGHINYRGASCTLQYIELGVLLLAA